MELFDLICCPSDHQKLKRDANTAGAVCNTCGTFYPMVGGVPVLFDAQNAPAVDQRQKVFYEDVYQRKMSDRPAKEGSSETTINRLWRQIRDFYASSKSVNEVFTCFQKQFTFSGEDNVLEIGCGMGTPGTDECIKFKNKINYVGLDFALNQLSWLENDFRSKGAEHFKLINADILDPVFPDGVFDLIFGRGILHHFSTTAKIKLAKRINGLLKPGGKAFFLEPLNTNPMMQAFRFLTRPFRPNLIWEHPFSSAEIKDFVSEFEDFKIHYFEAFSMLSLFTAYHKTLFEFTNKHLRKIDKALTDVPFFKRFFTKSVIVVYKH